MSDSVPIFYENILVGTIELGPEGPTFTYDPAWSSLRGAFPLSVRIPLGSPQVPPLVLVPWLMNLLPEGTTLQTMGRTLGTAPQDVVGMIRQIGRDTAGALSFDHPRRGEAPGYRQIPDAAALERIITELPAKPFLVGDEGVSMSLAGAQEKLPLTIIDGKMAIPINGAPSTHILKPDNPRLYGSVQNEAFCLVLARRAGLSVAEVTTGIAGERPYLLVTRYDRFQRNGQWFRLHQEDFCQALGKPPGAKYEHNSTGIKGPGLADFFALARQHLSPADLPALTSAIVLNVLLTNVDSHAKNYSILLTGRGARLAPLYDLMCGSVWPNITQNMAQDVGGKNRGRYIMARHWRRMAKACGLNATNLLRRVISLAKLVSAEAENAADEVQAMPAGGDLALNEAVSAVQERCRTVLLNLENEASADGQDEHDQQEQTFDDVASPLSVPIP